MSDHRTTDKATPRFLSYLYGSTDVSANKSTQRNHSSGEHPDGVLLGESLMLTDNEGDPPPNGTTGFHDGELQPLLGSRKSHRRPSDVCQCRLPLHNSPVVCISFVMGLATLALIVLDLVVLPMVPTNYRDSGVLSSTARIVFPFPRVNRDEYGDPVSGFLRTELFHRSLLNHKQSNNSRIFRFPFPTGAFWTNLVLPATADRGLSYPAAVYPYAYKWSDTLLQVSYPASHRQEDDKAIHDYFFPDLTFTSSEEPIARYLRSFDPLSVTLRFRTGPSSFWETYLVQGSPYITIKYSNTIPTIRARSIFLDVFCPRDETIDDSNRDTGFGVCSLDSKRGLTTLQGIQFILQTAEGDNWFVFSSEPITLKFDVLKRTFVEGNQAFNGVIRVAYVSASKLTNSADNDIKVSSSKALQRLIYHAGVYPVGGKVTWNFRESSVTKATSSSVSINKVFGFHQNAKAGSRPRIGTLRFQFNAERFAPAGVSSSDQSLLMLALPHHARSIAENAKLQVKEFELTYSCIKGPLTPILGFVWSMDEVLPTVGFDLIGGHQALQREQVRLALSESLNEDVMIAQPTLNENVYGFGKQVARMAQLSHIARTLRLSTADMKKGTVTGIATELASLEQTASLIASSALEGFFRNSAHDSLVYDEHLGGLVSSVGLADKEADFGNGRYNDHHFHYGYILFACAVIGRSNATFVEEFGDAVDTVFNDIAYHGNTDSSQSPKQDVSFPLARHKSWFDGHSFASGLFPAGNGKSQESSSEAVNAYYGAYLWSVVRSGHASTPSSDTSARTDFTRLLLAMEIKGAQTYWHMNPSSGQGSLSPKTGKTFSSSFSENFMVGNLGMLNAICSTWFGTKPLYVYMINFLPVTAVTEVLFPRDFVASVVDAGLIGNHDVEMAWQGFNVANRAIVDPNSAWRQAQALFSPELDAGISKTQVMYWVATRPGFNATSQISQPVVQTRNITDQENKSCVAVRACAGLHLRGDCCPNSEGTFLDCCHATRK